MTIEELEFFDSIKVFLPKYLTPKEQHQLYEELKAFPNNKNYYLCTNNYEGEYLQGDGWNGFCAINFNTLKKKKVKGIIISNSCDISKEHDRAMGVRIMFAPIIGLKKYKQLLKQLYSDKQINSMLTNIRKQKNTSLFYLPKITGKLNESIVLLDDIHIHPMADFDKVEKERLFILNQYGFYLFLIKLSIHFSRFQEALKRF